MPIHSLYSVLCLCVYVCVGGNKFVVAVDGSINSDHAVAECLRLATVDDTVQIVHIATPGSDELQTAFQPNAIVDKYTTDTKQAKNVSVVKVDVNHRNIAQGMCVWGGCVNP